MHDRGSADTAQAFSSDHCTDTTTNRLCSGSRLYSRTLLSHLLSWVCFNTRSPDYHRKDRFDFSWRDQVAAQPQRSAVIRRQDATPSPDIVTVASSTGNPTTRAGPTTSFGVAPTSNYVDPDQTITIDDGFAEIPQVTASGTSSQDVDDLIIISTSPTDTYGGQTAARSNYVETEKTVAVTATTNSIAYVPGGIRTITPKLVVSGSIPARARLHTLIRNFRLLTRPPKSPRSLPLLPL